MGIPVPKTLGHPGGYAQKRHWLLQCGFKYLDRGESLDAKHKFTAK